MYRPDARLRVSFAGREHEVGDRSPTRDPTPTGTVGWLEPYTMGRKRTYSNTLT